MNKSELLAYIATLVAQLTELNIEFTPAETQGTNAELEKEIERLESLLPDEPEEDPDQTEDQHSASQAHKQALESSKGEDKKLKEDAAADEKTRYVAIKKGVNIETIQAGKKIVLGGGNSYYLPVDFARSLVAENHGNYDEPE